MIPHFFRKEAIPQIFNFDLLVAIGKVKLCKNQEEALSLAFSIITNRFCGKRFATYLYFWKAFGRDPNVLWNKKGFMHCMQQNYLLRILLINSGWFLEHDVKLAHSFVWYISPHQYLKVKIHGKWIALDPWNANFGCKIGQYASGFGYRAL